MRWSYVAFLLALPLILEVLVACCPCNDFEEKFFTNEALFVANIDNGGARPVVTGADSIAATVYGIHVQVVRSIVAQCPPQIHFTSTASASNCKCGDIQANARDVIIGVRVISQNDFSESRPAGSIVSNFFRINNDNFTLEPLDTPRLVFLTSFLNRFYTDEMIRVDKTEFDLVLIERPQFEGQHQFTVQLAYADGTTFEQDAPAVILY